VLTVEFGIYNLNIGVAAKRLELLHDLVPAATLIAYLRNPNSAVVSGARLLTALRPASWCCIRRRRTMYGNIATEIATQVVAMMKK
jgi:hypothetical protein